MTYIYFDESGDLGINRGSNFFIVSCVRIEDENNNKEFCRILKRVRNNVLKKKLKEIPELKFSNSGKIIREHVLRRISMLDLEIYTIIIYKKFMYKNLQDNLSAVYNYLIRLVLENALKNSDDNSRLEIYLDRCMSRSQRENFEKYIQTTFSNKFRNFQNAKIIHENSENNAGLQATDFIAGSIGYKYNHEHENPDEYISIIKDKMRFEKSDLFRKK